jgi:glycosyltransferase involved in cell wall biosynthesis
MIKVVMIARANLYKVPGGDTVQIIQTASQLANIGVSVHIKLTGDLIDYAQYDLLHFFNIIRPADILYHIKRCKKPFVVSPILVDYSEFDKNHRKGFSGLLFRFLSNDAIEYLKIIARWLLGKDKLISKSYLWIGHRRAIKKILKATSLLLPNSHLEYKRIVAGYTYNSNYVVVPNGIDPDLFQFDETIKKDDRMVICVARVEGIKNQLHLIRALNNTRYNLFIIGSAAPNQHSYYKLCKQLAKPNITFIEHISQHELKNYYQKAKVHALTSWFETTGLSSLEAGAMGCSIVIAGNTDATEYFGEDAFYCDASSPESIYTAIEKASVYPGNKFLQEKIYSNFTWHKAAVQTKKAYEEVMQNI